MKFPPVIALTAEINVLLADIENLKTKASLHRVSPEMLMALRRQALLKSSLYSARIEGNPLELSDIEIGSNVHEIHKQEVANLVIAYERLLDSSEKSLSPELFKEWHRLVLSGISGAAGHFRTEESAIFNQAGVAVYLAPASQRVVELMGGLCEFVNVSGYPAPVVAAVAHIWFEKIHPFLDGNGRVGRLLVAWILKRSGYDFSGLVSLEEYLDLHRDAYYTALAVDKQEVSGFVEYFLTAIVSHAQSSLARIEKSDLPKYPGLLPRRAEIVQIISDHKIVSFDFLRRRFRAVPDRTLHNDLQQLVRLGLIEKLGATRGVMYAPMIKHDEDKAS